MTTRRLSDPDVQLSLVVAACLLTEAVIAKNVLDVSLDFISQFAPMWVFIAFEISPRRDLRAAHAAMVAAVVVTGAVLALYAV